VPRPDRIILTPDEDGSYNIMVSKMSQTSVEDVRIAAQAPGRGTRGAARLAVALANEEHSSAEENQAAPVTTKPSSKETTALRAGVHPSEPDGNRSRRGERGQVIDRGTGPFGKYHLSQSCRIVT
jgi:hypothetical protein